MEPVFQNPVVSQDRDWKALWARNCWARNPIKLSLI